MKTNRYLRCELRNSPRAVGDLRFCLDPANDGQMIRDRIRFKGWVVHKSQAVREVICKSVDGAHRTGARPRIHRPGVASQFRDFHSPDSAGFELEINHPAPGEYQFLARIDDGEVLLLDTARVTEHSRPKLLFMHIAKTAGTSVNNYFASQYPQELVATHVESDLRWRDDREYVSRLEFMSGHIGLAQFQRKLDLADYYKVTLLREPFAHLRSHLAWIRRLSDPGETARLERHPAYVRELSGTLRNLDLSDAAALGGFVESLDGEALQLLDNCQTRYLSQVASGKSVEAEDYRVAEKSLERFEKVGVTESVDGFLRAIARELQFEKPYDPRPRNVSRSHYGLDIRRREVRECVYPLVRFDLRLYRFLEANLADRR